MPTIKRFKISDTDPLAIIDLGRSMKFREDDLGNVTIEPPHVICRADTATDAEHTLGLLNAVAPLAETLDSVHGFAIMRRPKPAWKQVENAVGDVLTELQSVIRSSK